MELSRMAFAANMMVNQCLAIQKGETVLIITDTDRPRTITQALVYSAVSAGAEVVVMTMEPAQIGGQEPPAPVAAAMAASRVVINQSTHSLTHTAAVREAIRKGARIANLRNMTEEMMVNGGIRADYRQVKRITERVARLLTEADVIRMTTPEGTDLTMRSRGRTAIAQTGFVTRPGELSGLPDGEATLAPLEGVTEGVVVAPYIADSLGLITDPFRMEIAVGRIVRVAGGQQAHELTHLLERHDEAGRNAASQFALGTNPACRVLPNTREVSKKLGTAHFAIGDNLSLGGASHSDFHIDFVFLSPTVSLDGTCILKDGQYQIDLDG
ncbi:MAG TPA: aminopeptidase [Candidatus Methylomirabilis sp.]|nr:aminopeptidase [Candidatus Methylomirabilis sp.]HSC71224.1 aminopeptidase [Candidatus Methylomirabilis sp.]